MIVLGVVLGSYMSNRLAPERTEFCIYDDEPGVALSQRTRVFERLESHDRLFDFRARYQRLAAAIGYAQLPPGGRQRLYETMTKILFRLAVTTLWVVAIIVSIYSN
jgi:hypothetical protein